MTAGNRIRPLLLIFVGLAEAKGKGRSVRIHTKRMGGSLHHTHCHSREEAQFVAGGRSSPSSRLKKEGRNRR